MLCQRSVVLGAISLIIWKSACYKADAQNVKDNRSPTALPRKDGNIEYEALQYLHRLLDEDSSGYIDVEESVDFLHDELNVKGKNKDRLSQFHQDDPQVSVDELWGTWRLSEVHNWTVDQVVEWLSTHVELPQYAVQFRLNSVDGTQMPRMASNSPEFITSNLNIRDPIHKRKISLKATDAVLFGAPKRDLLGPYKEWILLIAIGIATCGVWLAYMQRRKYESRMRQVSADLENIQQLERQLSSLQEKVGKSSNGSEGEMDGDKKAYGDNHRLQEAEEELSVLRDALQRAEQRTEARQWTPPIELEILLHKTYRHELENFRLKRAGAEKQLHEAREECEKLYKKQQGVFGAFRIAHGSQLNAMDDGLVSAKQSLTELAADTTERSVRWCRIEILTGLSVMGNMKVRGAHGDSRARMSALYVGDLSDIDHESVRVGITASSHASDRGVPSSFDLEDSFSVHSYDSVPTDIPGINRPPRHVQPDKLSREHSAEAVAPVLVNGKEYSVPPSTTRTNDDHAEEKDKDHAEALSTKQSPLSAVPHTATIKYSSSRVSLANSQISNEEASDLNKAKKKRFASMRKMFKK